MNTDLIMEKMDRDTNILERLQAVRRKQPQMNTDKHRFDNGEDKP